LSQAHAASDVTLSKPVPKPATHAADADGGGSPCRTPAEALDFVRRHGVVLASAKGPLPRLSEAIVGAPVSGSWWSHPQSHRIYALLGAVCESEQVLVCRLVNGKITLVHRRLWPSLVRLADAFAPEQLAQVREEHTPFGRHRTRAVPFPNWVPRDCAVQARLLTIEEARLALPAHALGAGTALSRRT
jgi:hypothetical protein